MRFYAIQVSGGPASTNLNNIIGAAAIDVLSRIAITGQPLTGIVPAGLSVIAGSLIPGSQWCSVVNGINDPGALDIEFDLQLSPQGYLNSGYIKIYGVLPSLISQASYFTGCQVTLYGGFIPGLPLATLESAHTGILGSAQIYPAIGNWVGNELSLSFILNFSTGNPGGPTAPKNIIHNMPKGTTLGTAIENALKTAFPNIPINLNISSDLVLGYDDKGFYQSIEQYLNYVKTLSHSILGTPDTTGYHGVKISNSNSLFNVFDGTIPGNTVQLLFEDLIGQPTWVAANTISVKVALRADIQLNDYIVLPQNVLVYTPIEGPGYQTLYPPSAWLKYQPGAALNFQGKFQVTSLRHMGRFRNPNAETAWVTVIEANADPGSTSSSGGNVANQSGQQVFHGGGH